MPLFQEGCDEAIFGTGTKGRYTVYAIRQIRAKDFCFWVAIDPPMFPELKSSHAVSCPSGVVGGGRRRNALSWCSVRSAVRDLSCHRLGERL